MWFLTFPAWSDNSSLNIRFYDEWKTIKDGKIFYKRTPYRQLKPCEELIELRYRLQKAWVKDLYAKGIPKCKGYDFPDEWLEKKEPFNAFAYTKCDIGCKIRQFPLMGSSTGNVVGRIDGTNRIFLDYKVTSIKNIGFEETISPWYRHWYAFTYKGQTYYIWVDNIE